MSYRVVHPSNVPCAHPFSWAPAACLPLQLVSSIFLGDIGTEPFRYHTRILRCRAIANEIPLERCCTREEKRAPLKRRC